MPDRDRPRRWGDLPLRVASALVLLPVGVGGLWLGGWAWIVLVMLAGVGLAFEWQSVCGAPRVAPAVLVGAAAGFAALGQARFGLLVLAGGLAASWWQTRRLLPALGVPYVGAAVIALIWLRAAPASGLRDVLVLLLVVWATDIAAYLAGRLVGGPKLAPRISPGKTWSGAAGGLAGALLVGALAGADARTIGLAAVLSIVSQAGDLAESGLKRRFGVKDSGKLIPGHGGLLDRLDGVLAAAPVAALLALGAGRGAGLWP